MLELFHAAPSYYSMVARLALAEAGVPYVSRLMDIHLAKQQLSPAYRALNPHMTVPTLRGPGVLLTDSAQILSFAAQQAARRPQQAWADADASRVAAIQQAVAGHYAISIETLTFGKLLATRPWFQSVMVRMLSGINAKLEREASQHGDQAAVLQAKVRQNQARLAVFGGRPAAEVLAEQRDQVSSYLASLPPVVASGWLFGACISSADVVVAVLCSRLAMAGELGLLSRADLQSWWQRYQQRPAFSAADLWLRFQRRRFLQSLLEARHTSFS
ncbi:MAG: glutathione S-transferase family protein [Cyanobacteria bacterium M_surface_7_m2_037]|nr:glutathione S-transferase family protein [Cyanobacteria bacterium K_DeepCast_0m_m1_088]MBM5794760.1 glutathione S-transferase family protein [Cyanobacteria bacterium M_surface_7_m2_037]